MQGLWILVEVEHQSGMLQVQGQAPPFHWSPATVVWSMGRESVEFCGMVKLRAWMEEEGTMEAAGLQHLELELGGR